LDNQTSVGVNIGADLYLLNNLPSVVNDVLHTPFHFSGNTQIGTIPIADTGVFQLAFNSQHYDFLM
jgi:hypothetical protein